MAWGTCAGLGTILAPVILNVFYPEAHHLEKLTASVIIGVVVTLVGIAIIGVAGNMKSQSLSEEEKKAAVKDFNFPKGIAIALLAGFMSGCFNVGLEARLSTSRSRRICSRRFRQRSSSRWAVL